MSDKSAKPSRRLTQEHCERVARDSVGDQTALDAAFAVFDDSLGEDPERVAAAQAHLRALLAPPPRDSRG